MNDKMREARGLSSSGSQNDDAGREAQRTPPGHVGRAVEQTPKRYASKPLSWDRLTKTIGLPNVGDKTAGGLWFFGELRRHRKITENVLSRSLFTLDADDLSPTNDLAERVKALGCAAVMYPTHQHTAEAPRYRVLVLPDRAIAPDEYRPALMALESRLGGGFDPSMRSVAQAIYAPTTTDADEYRRRVLVAEGEPVSVDDLLVEADALGLQIDSQSSEEVDPYDGPDYDALAPERQAWAREHVEVTIRFWRERLTAAADWPEGQHDDRGRGWDAMARDTAYALAKKAVHPAFPLGLDEAERTYRELVAPFGSAVTEKWGRAVDKAENEPLEVVAWPSTPAEDFEPVEEDSEPVSPVPGMDLGVLREAEGQVFGASPLLGNILRASRSRLVAPWAVLGSVLARVLAETPVPLMLPPTIGTAASLNFAVALVGPSGFGKTTGNGLAGELLDRPEAGTDASEALMDRVCAERPVMAGVGSGEGIAQSFLRWEGQGQAGQYVIKDYPHTLLVADEVSQIGEAGNGRSGSTLGSVLRKALTGDALTTTNATRDRNRRVDAKTYRFCLIVGVQPELSGVLLNESDAASGTPQRFLWLPAFDPFMAPGERWEGGIGWAPTWDDQVEVPIPPEARELIVRAHVSKNRGLSVGLNGHTNLTRLKVAAALAILHDEIEITSQWWDIAGVLIQVSDMTRAACEEALAIQAEKASTQKGRALGVQQVAAADVQAEHEGREMRRYAVLLWKTVHQHTQPDALNRKHEPDAGCTSRCRSFALRNHRKKHLDMEAIAREAEERGWLERDGDRWRLGEDQPEGVW